MEKKKKTTTKKTTRVPKTRNNNTMTESAFFQWLRHNLRKSSLYWKPVAQVRKEAQVPYIGLNKRRKYLYRCSMCGKDFLKINIHHKKECGTLMKFDDLPAFVENLFCEKQGLIALCDRCHETLHENNNLKLTK